MSWRNVGANPVLIDGKWVNPGNTTRKTPPRDLIKSGAMRKLPAKKKAKK